MTEAPLPQASPSRLQVREGLSPNYPDTPKNVFGSDEKDPLPWNLGRVQRRQEEGLRLAARAHKGSQASEVPHRSLVPQSSMKGRAEEASDWRAHS